MANGYTGWNLFEKVTIIAKKMFAYDYKTGTTTDTGKVKGYLVDPTNKKQLENARAWGTTHTYEYFTDEKGCRSVKETKEHKPEEYTYDNDGFTLELHNSAGGSSQGGKLSFWNCWITAPDGKKFLIGIAADLLLDVLKSNTVIDGVVQNKLMFARCHGGVGMLSENMDSYKNAINDKQIKKNVSKGKTSKHIPGHTYETVTQKDVYVGKFYRWYEPIMEKTDGWRYYCDKVVGFKKLATPVEMVYFPTYESSKTKISEYEVRGWQVVSKAPTRKEATETVEIDLTMDEIVTKLEQCTIYDSYDRWKQCQKRGWNYIDSKFVGVSASKESYTMPKKLREVLIDSGFRVED